MGDGNDVPDTPDYSPVIDAITKSLNFSTAQATQLVDFFKKAYDENIGTGRIVIDKALKQMDKLAEDSDYFRNQYRQFYEPAEKKYLADALKMGTQQEQEIQAGKAEQEVAAKAKAAKDAAMARLESYGIAPDQAAAGALDRASRVAEAGMQAAAGNQAREATREEGRKALLSALGIGQANVSRVNPAAAGSLAAGAQGASIGPAITQSAAQTMGTPQGWTQLGNQSTDIWGRTLGQSYEDEMARWKANEESSSGWGQIAGIAAPFIGKAFGIPGFDEGGAIPEMQSFQDGGQPLPEEMSPSGGAIPDDIPAQIEGGPPAQLSAGEFVVPEDVVKWVGEKGMQQFIVKARKEMGSPEQAPAQPEVGPPPTMEGAGIPMPPQGIA